MDRQVIKKPQAGKLATKGVRGPTKGKEHKWKRRGGGGGQFKDVPRSTP